ncbi:hypothetical protein [Actinacidiphila glaucinigra]|uniref:hypothetical protein n=1 Tax=Actinacidiphila glaucinigra TaxID=235986 RepID=UPI0036733C21
MPDDGLIDVTLVDVADGRPFGRSGLPAGQLPESFTPETRLELGGAVWEVVRADPADRPAFLAAGRLVLTLRRLLTADPRQIGYTLPTLCAELPPLTPPDGTADDLEIHEDEWRQAELVERRRTAEVEAQLAAVTRVVREHARTVGEGASAVRVFDELHLRETPAEPLTGTLTRQRLLQLLPAEHVYTGVALRDGQGRVADSFAARVGPVAVYGRCAGDRVVTLGLTPAARATVEAVPGLAGLMREFGLVLVDWCAVRCEELP